MKPTTLLWCAAVVAACANVASPTIADTSRLAEAQRLLAEDPHAALNITDELLKRAPDWREARLCAATGMQKLAMDSTSGQPQLLLQDAIVNLRAVVDRAERGTEPDAWQMLAECHFQLGEFEAAAGAATNAAEGYAAKRNREGRQQAAKSLLYAGDCGLRTFAAARQQELDTGTRDQRGRVRPSPEVAAMAAALVAKFEGVRSEFPGEACAKIATVYQFLGQDGAAQTEFERGIRSSPTAEAVHTAYIDWMVSLGQQEALVGAYAGFVRENPSVPLLQWFAGRSLFARADQLRSLGDFRGAIAAYEKANAAYGQYAAMQPNHADAARQWLALGNLSMARVSIELGDLQGARAHLFAADEASPLTTTYDDGMPRLADSFRSHYTGVISAMTRALAESGENGVQLALEWNEAVLQRHPDRWGFVYNNAALPARDLGVQLEQQGKHEEAMALWERSYQYYCKAVQLSPDDARIVNDCGLMLIYHLDRDFDRAKELFERAIAVGQPQLDELPADTDRRDRELLEEAVGDAWQNLAMLARKHQQKPFAEYRDYCTKAVQYYPYERRSAQALLRSEGQDDGESPAVAAALQGGAADALAKVAGPAKAKAAEGDFDGALTLLDGIAKECKEHAPYHAMRGDFTLKLAMLRRDEGKKGVEFLFQDAVAALKKAVALDSDPTTPRQLLAQALYDSNDLEGAAAAASALLLHLQSKGGGKADELAAVHLLRANAAARAFATQKNEGKDNQELLTAARTSFRVLESQGKLDAALLGLWSVTEQWAGAAAEAVNVYARALKRSPDDQALLGALVDAAAAQKQMPIAIETLQARTDATALWYLGKARYLLAATEREGGKNAEAQKTLDAAIKAFADSMQKNGDFRDSCEQWTAMCLGKKGNIAFRSDDVANAEKWLMESIRLRPDRITEDLGLAETTKLGLLLVADKFFRKGDLAKTEALYRAASDLAHGDLDLLNNSGLFARDHGNQLERNGKMKEAMNMYEQSYKAYRRAQQLDPANVRLRNDCALIAIYHLDRDWELSKELLDAAIADGKKMLEENPPSDAQEKQALDEAVGDCYENLALWHLKHSKDYAAAKAAATQSQGHYPGARRGGARRHLQEAERLLQGK